MLELKNIVKCYSSGDSEVMALGGVSMRFRENEFVSILGKSGCGKTTLLNIIGGLDRYTSGDLIINGRSTKEFRDSDWDTYRNHSIGFVFQSYNLIPHQTVLSNVELALTLSGVSKAERRKRAVEALEKVGLGNQLKKKPNQMSGGQMQRVAIARALVNNPDILLADEPTGALDTQTSVQIMDILREVAKDKLVVMVTHNPDLAEEYSNRIIRLSDGLVTDDTNPYSEEEAAADAEKKKVEMIKDERKARKAAKKAQKKKTMSFATALTLSFNNLLTKKARTILTSFAGSIGIIGIALILSLSNGIQAYIDQVQEDTLSTYPLTISAQTQDYSAMLAAMTEVQELQEGEIDQNKIYVDDSLGTMMSAMMATTENDLVSFKKHLDENYDKLKDSVSDIQYTYDFDLQVFTADGKVQVSPTEIFDNMGDAFAGISEMMEGMGGLGIMSEMINNKELLDQQYELVGENSHWPTKANEVVLVVNKNNQISKMTLYMLGVLPQEELEEIMTKLMTEGTYEDSHMEEYSLDDFLGMKFYMLNTSDFYEKNMNENSAYTVNDTKYYSWNDIREYPSYDQQKFVTENGTELVISGIVRPRDGVTGASIAGAIGYTKELTDLILDMNLNSEVIKQQKETPDYNVLTGLKFERTPYTPETISDLISKIDDATMDRFYPFVTQMILTNPELAAMLDVKDPQSLLGVLFLMPTESQVQTISAIYGAALRNDAGGVKTLTDLLTMVGAEPKVQITPENFLKLLPILSPDQIALALMGMPANPDAPMIPPTKGLITLAGDDMTGIYEGVSSALKAMEVNEEIFTRLIENGNKFIPDFANSETFRSLEETLYKMAPQIDATYKSNLKLLGDAEAADPASINFYAKDFDSKDTIEAFIKDYNDAQTDDKKKIEYTDIIGAMMSSVSLIINVISYVLIAFVSISLVVSSIMIGIITYISVLERTKEIGILRSIGASKKDISRVFNAETLIVGLAAGLIGILATVLLCLPINAIIHALSGIYTINAALPVAGGIALVLISVILTVVAGLIPSRIASKKDPVEALRTE
ncbi:MAG: ABC transporter ATP-binding protein/permease [Ruminococcaceae bacterium]|nr:ABC transporter ATP-binding protein/permease [Oscillospiraceae bacterium]